MKKQTDRPIWASRITFEIVLVLVVGLVTVPVMPSTCLFGPMKLTAYGTKDNFSYPELEDADYRMRIYDGNLKCGVLFSAFFRSDHVQLSFNEVKLAPPELSGDYSTCSDRIDIYDGNTTSSTLLVTICGSLTPSIQSKGNQLLLVFTTNEVLNGDHGRFSLSYQRVNKKHSSSGGLNIAWTAIAIPALAIASCLTRCGYQKCKTMAVEHEMEQVYGRSSAAESSVGYASRQPLNSTTTDNNGHGVNQPGIEGAGEHPAATPSAPSYSEVVQPGRNAPQPPPPSYEEAASGKYDRKPV